MKKHSKIITLALSLVLLVGLCFGVSAMAEENAPEKNLTVLSQNVSYSEELYLHYAVYPENVDVAGLKLLVYAVDPAKNAEAEPVATVTDSTQVTITDVETDTDYVCRAFKAPGIALKNLASQIYVKAVAADGTESAVRRYSVAEYLNEMSFTTTDSAKAAAYRDILKAGDAAQLLLNHETDAYASSYKYVTVTDGKDADGYDRGIYLPGSSLSLTYTGNDSSKNAWKVTNLQTGAEEYVLFGNAITVNAHISVEASVKPYQRGEGVYYSDKASHPTGTYADFNFDSEGTPLNGFSNAGTATGVMTDGAATLTKTVATWKQEHFYYNIAESSFTGDISNATCKVFEFDWKIGSFNLGSNDGRNMFRFDDSDYVALYKNSDGSTFSLGAKDTATIKADEWCNVRFEFYKVSGAKYVQIYVNDVYAHTQTLASTTNDYNNRIYFYLDPAFNQVGAYVSVDNLIMIYIEKDYVAK